MKLQLSRCRFGFYVLSFLLFFFFSQVPLLEAAPPRDSFILLDVSGSMNLKPEKSADKSVFDEVRQYLRQDIETRQAGDHVAFYIFGTNEPRLVTAKTVETDQDKQQLIEEIRALTANDGYTFLHVAILSVLKEARGWARTHPDHNVDLRIYTDGANNGPNLMDQVRQEVTLSAGDHPNLKFYLLQYVHHNASPQEKQKMNEQAESFKTVMPVLPFDTVFVDLNAGRTDFGNVRASAFGARLFLQMQFNRHVDKIPVFVSARVTKPADSKLLLVFDKSPFSLSNTVVEGNLVIKNAAEIPADVVMRVEGLLEVKADEKSSPKAVFNPSMIPFNLRIAPLRQFGLRMTKEDGQLLVGENIVDGALALGLTDSRRIIADRGLKKPMFVRFDIRERNRIDPSDTMRLQVRALDPAIRAEDVARFVKGPDDLSEGQTAGLVTPATNAIWLRLDYSKKSLSGVVRPGYYPIEIEATADDPDLSLTFMGTPRPDKPQEALRALRVRLFPGVSPPEAEWKEWREKPQQWNPDSAIGGLVVPPPSPLRRSLTVLAEALLVGFLLYFLGFVCRGLSLFGGAVFGVIVWFSGSWWGPVIVPLDCLELIPWAIFGVAAIILVVSPSCFAWTPWWGGWQLSGTGVSPSTLRVAAQKRRRLEWDLIPFRDRILLRVGGGQKKFDVHVQIGGHAFNLTCPPIVGKSLRLTARIEGVTVNGQSVPPGTSRDVGHGDRIVVQGKQYNLFRSV